MVTAPAAAPPTAATSSAETLCSLLRIRTLTAFIGPSAEPEAIAEAAVFLRDAQKAYEVAGYEVQTVRIAADVLASATTPEQALQRATQLEQRCLAEGVSFINAGAACHRTLLAPGALAAVAAATSNASFSIAWQPGWGWREARQLAAAIHEVSERTAGAGSFRLGAAFGCDPRLSIPYFPVGRSDRAGFAIGLENSGLLHHAFQRAAEAAAAAAAGDAPPCRLALARRSLTETFAAALTPVEALARKLAEEQQQGGRASPLPYLGIDASIAPALEPPHLTEAYELLLGPGLRFGGAGSLAVSETITGGLKALGSSVLLCGYSGLMLPVCEDVGLAAAATEGRINLRTLLAMSSVCGCGLDTVPVPGATSDMPPAEREAVLNATAAVLLDVEAMAGRLGKPLSCRLLPVPGGKAGQLTSFTSPFLVDCGVMEL